jgi:SAM-dependent methyltransferase
MDHFYGELASWWPLISPPSEYAEEAAFAASILELASIPVRSVLELGSGGGHNAVHLKARFDLTLVDLSPQMLDVSRTLNPSCAHHVGDMRSIRLGQSFDAVFIHDAIDYMTTPADLALALGTAFAHCRPGGIAVFVPDHVVSTFSPGTDHGGVDGADGRGVRFLDWVWDPDPSDTWVQTDYAFLLRSPDGSVRVVHESHRTGLFDRDTWLRLITSAGFRAAAVPEVTLENRPPREFFIGHRP